MAHMSDVVAASVIQVIRAGISRLDVSLASAACCFVLAIVEGTILAASLSTRRRLTSQAITTLLSRVLFDGLAGVGGLNASLGVAGTVAGLYLGPVFHNKSKKKQIQLQQPYANKSFTQVDDSDFEEEEENPIDSTVTTPIATSHLRYRSLDEDDTDTYAIHTIIDVDHESRQAIPLTPRLPPIVIQQATDATTSETRVHEPRQAEGSDHPDTSTPLRIRTTNLTGQRSSMYQQESQPTLRRRESQIGSTKEKVKSFRSIAKNEDLARQALAREREKMLEEGDVAWAFWLKQRADEAKKRMEEADREAARGVFNYNNPGRLKGSERIDVHGLRVSEAITYCEEALRDVQSAGKTRLTVIIGRGKLVDGGKSVLKPKLRQYMRGQNIAVKESEDGTALQLRLPPLKRRTEYDQYE